MVFATGEYSACMIHLVGCAGHLHEAGDIINSKCTGNQMLLYYDVLVLVESLVMRILENAAQNEFLKLDLDMLWAMCRY